MDTTTPSAQDIEEADDILFHHPPHRIVRWVCGCGHDYPCPDVRWALFVKNLAKAEQP